MARAAADTDTPYSAPDMGIYRATLELVRRIGSFLNWVSSPPEDPYGGLFPEALYSEYLAKLAVSWIIFIAVIGIGFLFRVFH